MGHALVRRRGPSGPALHLDADHRAARRAGPVLRVAARQQGERRGHLAGPGQHGGGAVGARPPQPVPVRLVVVGEHRHAGLRRDVVQPCKPHGRLRLGVDRAVDHVTVHGEGDRDDVGPAARAHRGQARHGRGSEPPPRLARLQVQLPSSPTAALLAYRCLSLTAALPLTVPRAQPARTHQRSASPARLGSSHPPPNVSPGQIFPSPSLARRHTVGSTAVMPSHPLLAGRYRLESQIAAGGVGEVWRAEDVVLTRPVAVKLLRAEFAGHAETLVRFRAEARHAGALSHPAIARVYDYGDPVPPHPAFLVMELVDGPSLAAVLAAGPLDADQTIDVVAQVATGLQAAHAAALVHRDIKPANLLIAADGQVKITDFGIAHVAGSVPVTRTGTVMGTPAYLAPERVSGASATPASDLYSLGVVAYECLAGAQPFTGKPLEVAASHRDLPLPPFPHAVPADVAQLVAELTAKNPAARPASAQEVAARAAGLREDMAGGVGGAAAGWLYSVPDTVADIPAPAAAVRLNPALGWKAERPEPAFQAQRARRVRRHQQAERAPRGRR